MKEIYLPDYCQIGCNCFELCSNLIKVRFDKQIKTIGKAMFKDCTSLVDIILPENLFSIQMQAFSGCTSLSSILLPENLERILGNIFENCLSLTQIRIPSKIKCIPSYTFFGCRMLQSIDISDGVAIIENNAFQNCNIESVDIPPSVFNLGDKAFDSHTIVKGYQKRSTIFPDSPEDIIGFPTIGEHVKPIYYRLFSIEPNLGYDVAWVAINLMTGYLHRIDSKQVCYGVVVTSEDNVSGLSFDCLHEIGSHTQYREMTSENWKEYIPHEELEKAEKNVLKERDFDNSFTSSDNIEIDGLYIKLIQRFSTVAFYFRKTQTGYRLYSARTSGPHNLLLFDESRCNESFLYSHFVSPIIGSFTYADEEKDILLNKIEFLTILSSAPDLFSGKYKRYFGKKKSIKVPVSIYGDDIIKSVFWKNNKEIPCADYPGIKKIYDVLCKIK